MTDADRADLGVEVLRPLGLPEEALRIIQHQGERFDGSGTPQRLRGTGNPPGIENPRCLPDLRRPHRLASPPGATAG